MGRKLAKPKLSQKPKEKKRLSQTSIICPRYNQEEVRRLLGDQREGFSIPASPSLEGAGGIFGVEIG
jgi:hypothetical protein